MGRDQLAGFYNRKYAGEVERRCTAEFKPVARPANRYEAFMTFFPPLWHGGDLLEIGAGDGLIARSLIAHGVAFSSYTVSEFSSVRLEGLRKNVDLSRVDARLIDVEDLPADCGPFDAIVMLQVLPHLVDPLGALKALRARLKPGGFVYLDVANVVKWSRRLRMIAGRFPGTSTTNERLTRYDGSPAELLDEGQMHYFTLRSLRLTLVEACDFSRVTHFPYYMGPRLLGRAGDHLLARAWPGMFSELAAAAYG